MATLLGHTLASLLLAIVALVAGCQPAPPTTATRPASPPAKDAAPATPAKLGASREASDSREQEYWDALFFDASKVGYSHTQYQPIQENGRDLVKITTDSKLALERFGQTITQQMEFTSVETPEGEVIRCDSRMVNRDTTGAPIEITTHGQVDGNQLVLEVGTFGRKEKKSLDWNRAWGGFFAMEQSLAQRPMQPGEKRELTALLPVVNQLGRTTLTATDYEQTETLSGSQRLLRIEVQLTIAANTLRQTVWMDQAGQTIKSHMPALNQVSYRTDRETALGSPAGKKFDLGERTVVKVDFPNERPHLTTRATYRATLAQGDATTAFAQCTTQLVRGVDERTAEVVVRAVRPTDALDTTFPQDEPSQPADLQPNSLIQSDDEQVRTLATSIAADKSDPWDISVALEQSVRQYLSNKSFGQAMASAADVVRSREGDCTEHAVLLAALCRARQIPARVAIGLVYSANVHGFAYHMWTEVWVRQRWIPLDATLGMGGIGAAHLKVSHSNLQGVDPLSQFLPVFQLIGNLRLEVLAAD